MRNLLSVTALGLMIFSSVAYADDDDKPAKPKPSAVDEKSAPLSGNFVKVCDVFGEGYFFLPGSDTCLRVSGRIRLNAQYDTKVRKKAGSSYVYPSYAAIWADGRVGFNVAQATDLGTSVSAIRFAFNNSGGSSAVIVDQAYIGLGDIRVGLGISDEDDNTIFDFEALGENFLDLNANANDSDRLDLHGIGVQYDRKFGNVLVQAGVFGPTPYTILPRASDGTSNPVMAAAVSYSNGPLKLAKIGLAYDTAANSTGNGGWGIAGQLQYEVIPDLTLMIGIGHSDTGNESDRYNTAFLGGVEYEFNKHVSAYLNGTYIDQSPTKKYKAFELGTAYEVAEGLKGTLAEAFAQTTGRQEDWTTFVRISREF